MRERMPRRDAQSRVSTVQTSLASWLAVTSVSHFGCVSQMISAFGNDSRNAPTAGKACTMSPSEPSRTTRSFASAIGRLADGLQKFARGMILWIAYDRHANPQPVGHCSLGHALCRVVRSFGVHVGPNLL